MDSKEWIHSQSVSTSLDSLGAASKANIIPNKEYLLQGSITDSNVPFLLQRLQGLSDNPDLGPEPFQDQEMCFSLRGNPTTSNLPQVLQLRVRRAGEQFVNLPYQLRYIGEPELGTGDKARPTIVRSSVDVAVTSSILDYLQELGAKLEFEYIARGFMFRKGRMKIIVSKISKLNCDGQNKSEAISGSHLVELSVLAASGQEAIGDEMKFFSEQLKPLVLLDKIDYKRMPPLGSKMEL